MTPATANVDHDVRRSYGIDHIRNGIAQSSLLFINPSEVKDMRDDAVQLLNRLTSARIESEERSLQSGKPDPMGLVTGMTCLENAIEQTLQLIEQIDDFFSHRQNGRKLSSNGASENSQSFVSSSSL